MGKRSPARKLRISARVGREAYAPRRGELGGDGSRKLNRCLSQECNVTALKHDPPRKSAAAKRLIQSGAAIGNVSAILQASLAIKKLVPGCRPLNAGANQYT